jgi:hypothetical protein
VTAAAAIDRDRVPRLRSDIEVLAHSELRDGSVAEKKIVIDPRTKQVVELGVPEHFICSQLDGRGTVTALRKSFRQHFGAELSVEHLRAFVHQLEQLGLLEGRGPRSPVLAGLFHVLTPDRWQRFPFSNPHRLLARIDALTDWAQTRAFTALSVVAGLFALGVVYNHASDIIASVLTFWSWSLLAGVALHYLYLGFPSAVAQATTAVHVGGRVEQFGLRMLFDLWPLFYCKVAYAEIPTKRDRLWVLATPLRYSLTVFGFAVLAWQIAPAGTSLRPLLAAIAVEAVLFDIAIRANPLWGTDLSLLLAAWTDTPNLRNRAIATARAWWLLAPQPEPLTARERFWFRIYGTLCWWFSIAARLVALWLVVTIFIGNWGGLGALLLLLVVLFMFRRQLAAALWW